MKGGVSHRKEKEIKRRWNFVLWKQCKRCNRFYDSN
nr:MAG TPA: cysteine-rich protein [Caudoviricetes sp.]